MKKRPSEEYIIEYVEAYNVAIGALEAHEGADPPKSGIDIKLRSRLIKKLNRELGRWMDSLPAE